MPFRPKSTAFAVFLLSFFNAIFFNLLTINYFQNRRESHISDRNIFRGKFMLKYCLIAQSNG